MNFIRPSPEIATRDDDATTEANNINRLAKWADDVPTTNKVERLEKADKIYLVDLA